MRKVQLVAVKPLRYATRRLRAGDLFQASRKDAKLLSAVGLAAHAPASAAPQVNAVPEPDLVEALRARYGELSGQEANRRWGEARLRKEIEALSIAPTDDRDHATIHRDSGALVQDAPADQVEENEPDLADDGLPL